MMYLTMKDNTNTTQYVYIPVLPAKPTAPTHSRWMSEMGLPEFLAEEKVLGLANPLLVFRAAKYFSNPDNTELLNSILEGETVTINSEILDLADFGINSFSFIVVGPESEIVQDAFGDLEPEELTQMQFIQIYDGEPSTLEND